MCGCVSSSWPRTDEGILHQSFSPPFRRKGQAHVIHSFLVLLMIRYPNRWSSTSQLLFKVMTVLLKNLFTVHFQFDRLKLETNNTRDDKVYHAWIIARWTVLLRISLLDHRGDELGWFLFDPQACNLNGPPFYQPPPLLPPTPNDVCITTK